MGYVAILIGVVIFSLDLYFLWVSLGFRKSQCGKCKGYLSNTTQYKDVIRRGGKTGRFYKRFKDYSYVYRADGKQYSVSCGDPVTKGNLPRTVDVIYQKNHPEFSYIKDLTFPEQPIVAIMLCPLWIFLMAAGILLLIR